MQGEIIVRGGRTHNLQSVNVSIPRQSLNVITGVSGSGKSSFAFHTLFAEGQRRFLGTLPGRSRFYLDQLARPDVDSIQGLPPVISVSQQRGAQNSRSTLASITEILDYLRLLYARLGKINCPKCHIAVTAISPERIVSQILAHPERTKLMLLAPMVREKRGEHQTVFEQISKDGYVRARVNGEIIDLAETPQLNKNEPHTIEAVVDRLVIKPDIRSRLADSVDHALRLGDGMCIAVFLQKNQWIDRLFHRDYTCQSCEESFPSLEPRTFSWHNPHGACPACEGSGVEECDAPENQSKQKRELNEELTDIVCSRCQGARLNQLACNVRIQKRTLPELLQLPIADAREWLHRLPLLFEEKLDQIMAKKLVEPLASRFDFLDAVGVGYLSLDRRTTTLSGGELQRVRLARCLGTQLQGGCFILDEPTSGLHHQDTVRLLEILRQMVQQGNTVICVEHDFEVMREADYLIEFGPEGGSKGGKVLFAGSPKELTKQNSTPTSRFLSDPLMLAQTAPHQTTEKELLSKQDNSSPLLTEASFITLSQSNLHNLQNVSIRIPTGSFTCVSGVSGSGKSTLILDVLSPMLKQILYKLRTRKFQSGEKLQFSQQEQGILHCDHPFEKLLVVDQTPPGKNARSCPATFSGAWDHIRKLLALTKLSKIRGYNTSHFSFNSSTGTCTECKGQGTIRLKMKLLSDASVTCPACHGKRFNPQILAVKYRGFTTADLLEMTIDEAAQIWANMTTITQSLAPLQEIGLGYLRMGQPASMLSGGEAQRMKLAREMSLELKNSILILDEPTSGLHAADISKLLRVLLAIQKAGNTIVVIEHHPMVLEAANWHIELGPGSGPQGGNVLRCE